MRRRRAFLGRPAADELRVGRLAKDDPRLRPFVAQDACDAGDRSARAVAGDEVVEPLGEVVDDLAAGGGLVDRCVGLGFELVGEEPAVRLRQLDGLVVHADALLGAWREHDLRAEHAHQLATLDGEAVGHRHDQRVALLRADHRESDAGVATGGLHDGLAGLQGAVALGLFDDVDREPVLDGGSGLKYSAFT